MKPVISVIFSLILGMVLKGQEIQIIQDPQVVLDETIAVSSLEDTNFAFQKSQNFDFFQSEKPLKMTLAFDIKKFLRTKNNPEYLDATITIVGADNRLLIQKIKVKARGEMRRNYCSFPPIMLKFCKNKNSDEPVMSKGNMKLVTHCGPSASFQNYLFKEYLAYKLYNLVTPYSFKTRLVEITYVDVNNSKHTSVAYGFIIENVNQLAERNKTMVVDNPKISQKHMDEYEMARVSLFNYMIGNTDWSVQEQHNVKVLRPLDFTADKGIPVTYDFDYSGFVSTRYSAPNEKLPITYVTDRYFQGSCFTEELLNSIMQEFESHKDEFFAAIDNFEYLAKAPKKQAESYINGFFKLSGHPSLLMSNLNRSCKKLD